MSTLPQFLLAISHFHAKAHLPSPTLSIAVTRALEGAKRSFGRPSVSRKIITLQHLRVFGNYAFSDSVSFVRLRTIWRIFMQFFALLRFNEVASLTFDDLIWTPAGLDLFIKRSKTDQHAKGATVSLNYNSDPKLCPVRLTIKYIKMLKYDSGFLLPVMFKKKPDGSSSLKYHSALSDFKQLFKFFNMDPSGYGEHSGRRGGTTAAAAAGADLNELKLQGRWRSDSMPRLYTDNAFKLRRDFAARLADIKDIHF